MEYSFKTGTFTFKTSPFKTIVPPLISDYLSPLALGFMDDGSGNVTKRVFTSRHFTSKNPFRNFF